MGKALKLALAMSVASMAMHANAAGPSRVAGCTKTAKACTCYSHSGRPVEAEKEFCESKFAPRTVMTFEGGDISTLVTPVRIKPPVPENEPFKKLPIQWLIEH